MITRLVAWARIVHIFTARVQGSNLAALHFAIDCLQSHLITSSLFYVRLLLLLCSLLPRFFDNLPVPGVEVGTAEVPAGQLSIGEQVGIRRLLGGHTKDRLSSSGLRSRGEAGQVWTTVTAYFISLLNRIRILGLLYCQ